MEPAPQGYLQVADGQRLLKRRCATTGLPVEYIQSYCRCCGEDKFDLVDAGTVGELVSIVWYHRQYAPTHPAPYNVAVARMKNGPEVIGTLSDIPPGSHPLGIAVRVELCTDGRLLFHPQGDAKAGQA